jgi:hypothetical protein
MKIVAAGVNDPLDFPLSRASIPILFAPVAQLDRASDYGSEGCVFESRRVQVIEWQGLKVHNAPEDLLLAGDHLSHFLAIFWSVGVHKRLWYDARLLDVQNRRWSAIRKSVKPPFGCDLQVHVPLIVDDLVIGTGTLAQIDKTAGIFTARHVTTKIFERRKGKFVHGFLLTAPDEQPVILSVEIPYLDCWRPDGRDDKFGPDVAFLVLPEGHHFTSELRRKKSFVPISTDPGKRRKPARRKILAAVAGFVFGETKITGPESGFARVERPQGCG